MEGMIDAYTAERYRSLLLGDIEYLNQFLTSADPLEGSSGANFLNTAADNLSTLKGEVAQFHESVSAPRFLY